jgi:colicin import membrane protein
MAERKENSVLFSLNELRSIEEERQQEAIDSKRRAEEERIRSQAEAERRTREEADAQRRAAEDAERAIRENAERISRDDRFRLEEAERRARVEAQAQLEQQRLSQEMQIRAMEAQKKRPTGLIAVAGILVFACIGLAIFLYQRNEENARKDQEMAAIRADVDQKTQELDRLMAEQSNLIDDLQKAKDADAAQRAKDALAAKQAEIKAKREALNELKSQGSTDRSSRKGGGGGDKPKDEAVKIKCDPNDPLCGM